VKKVFLPLILILSCLFVFAKNAHATEGEIYLRSVTRETYRCEASSYLMQDQQYHVLVSCRDLLYPAGDTVFTYVLWAQPTDGSAPKRLGELGFGRLEARSNVPFSQLFVTTEPRANVNKPGGPTVMRGSVETKAFLDRGTPPSGTTTIETPTNTPNPSITVTPAPGVSTASKIGTAFKRAGLAALLALLALIGLIFAITRARG